jgi:hypothetical protein
MNVEGALHDHAQLINVDWLLIEIKSAAGDGPNGAVSRTMAGCDNYLCIGFERKDLLKRGSSAIASARVVAETT